MIMRTVRRATLALAVAAALAGLGVCPASAHDELIGSDPAADSAVVQAPAAVVLTFSADLLATGAAIEVVDAAGTEWSTGEVTVSGPTATRSLRESVPPGSCTVTWRAVSGDGHPVSGSYVFTVTEGVPTPREAPSASASVSASAASLEPSTAPSSTAPSSTTPSATAPEPSAAAGGGSPSPSATVGTAGESAAPAGRGPWAAIVAGGGLLGVALALILRRRSISARGPGAAS